MTISPNRKAASQKGSSAALPARAEKPLAVHLESVALSRLIAEIQGEEGLLLTGYNRTYHRHNR